VDIAEQDLKVRGRGSRSQRALLRRRFIHFDGVASRHICSRKVVAVVASGNDRKNVRRGTSVHLGLVVVRLRVRDA